MTFPPAQDLAVKTEPVLPVEAFEEPAVEDQWRDDVLIWGREGWRQVGRLCRYFKGRGMAVECPEP